MSGSDVMKEAPASGVCFGNQSSASATCTTRVAVGDSSPEMLVDTMARKVV
jgi:hypothetical protein